MKNKMFIHIIINTIIILILMKLFSRILGYEDIPKTTNILDYVGILLLSAFLATKLTKEWFKYD